MPLTHQRERHARRIYITPAPGQTEMTVPTDDQVVLITWDSRQVVLAAAPTQLDVTAAAALIDEETSLKPVDSNGVFNGPRQRRFLAT